LTAFLRSGEGFFSRQLKSINIKRRYNYNMEKEKEVIEKELQNRVFINATIDKRIFKIFDFIREKNKYPLSRAIDFALLFLITEHKEIIDKGITVLDAYLNSNPKLKNAFENLIKEVENSRKNEEK
jgi:hypothetical protein